ncbi:SpaA isopeptide-forming pilin-related protein [Enterococcus sp. DIV0187]|uniref:SpaA isopeptide-forming pilin-related protein n=1 Tax=Enterococcus sp. DIV0187 TaxID=2774644 RepID=UPI003F25A115
MKNRENMKRWVSAVMLLSIVGGFASPLLATATDTAESSHSNATSDSSTLNSMTSDPQQVLSTASEPIPAKTGSTESSDEITNSLLFDKNSEMISKDLVKNQYEMNLNGKINSSVENNQPVTFEMTKAFTQEDSKDKENNILNETNETIGEYTVDATGTRTKYTLSFNKLVKGENRFRLNLIGRITRGPDKTIDIFHENQKIFQLTIPENNESSENSSSIKSEETRTEGSKDSVTEATASSQESAKDSSKATTESTKPNKKKEPSLKVQAEEQQSEPRAAGPIDDLFSQYAPGDNFVKKIQLNFNPDPPTIHSTIDFDLDFTIPDAVRTEMVPGDYYEMDFPQGLTIKQPSPHGNLVDDDGKIYGNYEFNADTQKVRITFTKQENEDFLPANGGSISADVYFDQKQVTRPGKTKIIYPSKTNIPPVTVSIKTTGGSSISKAGQPDSPNNPTKINWQVDFNKDFSELTNPLVTEHFPKQVAFDKEAAGAVVVYPLNVDFNGEVTGTDSTPLDPSEYTVADDGSIQFNTPVDRPYRIMYSTKINDSAKPTDGGKVTVINNVDLTTDTINLKTSASVVLNYKKALEKVKTGYDRVGQVYSWLIRYNYGQKELANDTVVSDAYSSNMDVDPNSFNVYQVNFDSKGNPVNGAPINPKDYTIDTSTNPFTVTFKNNVQAGKAINIAYKTKVNKIVANNSAVQVTNQAKTKNLPPTTEIQTNPAQQVVIKNKPTIDVGTKTAHYLIDINKNKYEMEHALFTDTMSYTNEGYASFPFKVKVPESEADAGVYIRDVSASNRLLTGAIRILAKDGKVLYTAGDSETSDYVMDIHLNEEQTGYTDFSVNYQNAYAKTAHQFQMEYYITYNQFSEGSPNPNTSLDYKNTMNVAFTNNGQPYGASSSTDFKTSTQEVNQGMKSGSYNPATKEITWTIVTNYNNLGVSEFDFNDPITGNQVYEPDSLTVTRGTINASGKFQATTKEPYQGNQVGKSYLTVTNPKPTGENDQGSLSIGFGRAGNFIPGWDGNSTPMVYQIQFKTTLKNQIVYDQSTYKNIATVDIDGVKQELPASVSIAFGGKSAMKDANFNLQTGKINWHLTLNPNQSLLSNVKVEDHPSANQIIQEDSFKLYTGKYSGSGNETTVQPDQEVPTDQYHIQVVTDPATGQQTFTVDMSGIKEKADPNSEGGFLTGVIEKPYILTYETEPNFASKTEKVTNDASISSEGRELPGKDTEGTVTVTVQESGGSAYGTKGKVVVQKENGNGEVVPGAVLQLIRKNTQTNKSVILYQTTTDSQGMATFGNLIATSPVYEYYVKEIQAPDGYTISSDLLKGKRVIADTSNKPVVTELKNEPIRVIFNKTDSVGKALAGGLFSLYVNEGTKDAPNYTFLRGYEATTDGVDLSGLEDGQYYIQEVMAPAGYQINQTRIKFEVKKNDDNTRNVFVDDQKVIDGMLRLKDYQGSAVLKKTNETGKNLAGAQFNLQRAELNSNDYSDYGNQSNYVTNSNGQLNLTNLAPGKYKLKESKAPDGYYLNSKEMTFAIDPISIGNQVPTTIQLNNGEALIDYSGSARFKKVDGRDFAAGKETPLAGARFQLYTADGKTAIGNSVTSGTDGYFTFNNLAPGTTYAIKETQAPDNYLINQQLIRFTTPVSNNQGASAITIDNEGQKLVVDEKTPFKNYKEGVRFQKVDAQGRGLGGANYQLLMQRNGQWQPITDSANGANSNGVFTSDALDGNVRAFELAPGSYKFVEKTAPNGYLLNTKEIPFVVQAQAESEPAILDIPITGDANVNYQGSARLYKEAENTSDNGFSKLSGAAFDVYTDAAEPVKITPESIKSNADGNVTIDGLAPGNYYFQEVSNSNNYLVNTQKIKFTIPNSAAGKPAVVTTNDQTAPGGKLTLRNYLGAVTLTKVDQDDQVLRGAEFTIYNSSNKAVGTGISGPDGKVTINKLAPGDYTIKETKAPTGYLLNDQVLNVTIPASADGQPQTVTITEPFKDYQGSVKLIKTDDNDRPLAGAKFQLLDNDDHPVGAALTADDKGEVIFNKLAPGDYTFKEVEAPAGYLLNTTTVPVTVAKNADGQPAVVTVQEHFMNYQGTAELTKTDGDGTVLQGAKFKVVDEQGKDVAGKTAISDDKGLVRVTGLAPGRYRFVETEAPDKGNEGKYIMTSEDLAFEIPAESQGEPAIVKIKEDVANYRGTIRLHKVGNDINDDSKTVNLAEAEFTLYTKSDFSDTNPAKVKSDAKGIVEFKDLAPGTYYVKETAAPSGYLLNTFPLTFVIPERVPATMPMTDKQNHTNTIQDGEYVVDNGDFQNGRKEIELKKSDGESSGDLDLSQVAFALYIDDGSTDGELVKDNLKPENDGTIDLSNLALENGSYKLIEAQTASNYVISSQPIYFVVDNQQVNGMTLDLANYQASIKGRKVSGSKKLEGAEYQLFRADTLDQPIKTTDKAGNDQTIIKTDADGEFYAKGLSAGDYVLKETKAPKGYILDTTEHKFTVYPQKDKPITLDLGDFENYQGTAKLTKKAESGKLLPDAVFDVQTSAGKTVQTDLTTNENGEVTVKDLEPGDYQFVETKAPNGYLINTTPVPFTIEAASKGKPAIVTASENFVNYQGSAHFRKTNVKNTPLANAEFEVRDENDQPVGEKIYSDEDGYVTANGLAPGKYTFVETKAPDDYLINKTEIPFTIAKEAAGNPAIVEALNGENFIDYKGSAILTKTNADGTKLSGAVFNVLDASGNPVIKSITSNTDGELVANELAPGKYTFKEVKAPAGYLINADPVSFEIPVEAKGEPQQVQANNGENFINYKGSVEMKKVAFDRTTDDEGLAGAIFAVEDQDGKQIAKGQPTKEDGIVHFDGLAPGDYDLIEIEAPEGYLINSTKVPFTIPDHASGEPTSVQANDDEPFNNYKGTFLLIKQNKAGAALKDVEFDLFKDGIEKPVKQGTTDTNGVMTLTGLAPGSYHLIETYSSGYIVNQTPIVFTISDTAEGQPAVVMPDEPVINYQGSAKLIKTDENDKPLKDAEFEVLDEDNNQVGKTIKSNENGEVIATDLAPGDYVFKEVKAPTGYVINTTEVPFTIDRSTEDGNQAVVIDDPFINYQGSAKLIKTNEKGKKLADALFELQTNKGQVIIKDLKTNADGEIMVDYLAPGDYQFVETKAPTGYIINTKPVEFTIKAEAKGQPEVVAASENFINYQGKAVLTKVAADNTGKHLTNAEFQLLDSGQSVLREKLKTDADGKLQVTNLAPGKYYFKETKAPVGYQLSDKLVEFTIATKNNDKPAQVDVVAKNKQIPNTPNRPNQQRKPGQGFYPKTGEAKGVLSVIIGVILVLIITGVTYTRRNRNQK